jgi:hypothetical protein
MKRIIHLVSIVGLCACAAGAEQLPGSPANSRSAEATPAAPRSAAASSDASTAAAPSAAPPSGSPASSQPGPADPPPIEVEYPFKGLATIPEDCTEPTVVLTTAPKAMGWDYDWTWTRQAFHANPQFQMVDWPNKPERPMQVRLDMYAIPAGFALVGVCRDGATCNKLAAMYRSTVPTCDPRLHCGPLPIAGTPRRSAIIPADGQWLPVEDADVIGRCARIGVCLRMKHEPFRGNPGVVCQSSPSRFRIDCAKKATCDEVVECLR